MACISKANTSQEHYWHRMINVRTYASGEGDTSNPCCMCSSQSLWEWQKLHYVPPQHRVLASELLDKLR